MAKETPVLGRVVFRQGGCGGGRVTLIAEFFRFFFIHLHEFGMVFIIGKIFGRLFRRPPEKEEEPSTDNYKNDVVDEYIFAFCFLIFCVHRYVLGQSAISSMLKGISPVLSASMSISINAILTSVCLAEISTIR